MKGTITLPAGATAAACEKRVTLRIKKKKRVMAHRKAKLRFKADPNRCTFSKKVKLRRKKVGKTKKLRLTVSHPGNTVLQQELEEAHARHQEVVARRAHGNRQAAPVRFPCALYPPAAEPHEEIDPWQ